MDPRVFTVLETKIAETVSGGVEGPSPEYLGGYLGLEAWGDRRIHRKSVWRSGSKINILA